MEIILIESSQSIFLSHSDFMNVVNMYFGKVMQKLCIGETPYPEQKVNSTDGSIL